MGCISSTPKEEYDITYRFDNLEDLSKSDTLPTENVSYAHPKSDNQFTLDTSQKRAYILDNSNNKKKHIQTESKIKNPNSFTFPTDHSLPHIFQTIKTQTETNEPLTPVQRVSKISSRSTFINSTSLIEIDSKIQETNNNAINSSIITNNHNQTSPIFEVKNNYSQSNTQTNVVLKRYNSASDEDDITDWTRKKQTCCQSTNDAQSCLDIESTVETSVNTMKDKVSYLAPRSYLQKYQRSDNPSQWQIQDVIDWCIEIGMGRYVDEFRKQEVHGKQLLTLGFQDLRTSLLISNFTDQQKFTMEITKLRVLENKNSNIVNVVTVEAKI